MACFLSAAARSRSFAATVVALLDAGARCARAPRRARAAGAASAPARRRARRRPRRPSARKGPVGRQVGVDQDLVARLDAVEHARPDPARRRRRRCHPGARRVRQAARRARRPRCVGIEHHAVARQPRRHQARAASRRRGCRRPPSRRAAAHRRAASAATRARSLSAAVSPAVATPSVTSSTRDAPRPCRDALQASASAAEIGGAQRRRGRGCAWPTTPPPALALPANRDTTSWSKAATVSAGSPLLRSSASSARRRAPRRRGRARARRWCRRGCRSSPTPRARRLGERDDARHDQVVVAQAEARRPGPGAASSKSASG